MLLVILGGALGL